MKPVVIYTTSVCPYCVRAKMLFQHLGVAFEEVPIDADQEKRQEMLEKTGGRRTVPQILIDDVSIGGFDDLAQLHKTGKLDAMLKD